MSPDSSREQALDAPQNPLHERYASPEMAALFSASHRYGVWRRLWIALAEGQHEAGLPITAEQLDALRRAAPKIDLARVAEIEKETRHDVVAHLRHFAEQAGDAGGVLHLGATSMFVVDNTDALIARDALQVLENRLAGVVRHLANFARRHRATPTLAYTHLQPAQLTTVGKRGCLWAQDFLTDWQEIRRRRRELRWRGVKGTTGTQASYLALFDGDHAKVNDLDRRVGAKMGFGQSWPITGQTYPRKQDSQILDALAGVAESCHKLGSDIRLLQGIGTLSEPFGRSQVGSSAMAYKRNPIRAERMCALARRLLVDRLNGSLNAATQWLERSLDDSANRRLVTPDAFLTADAILRVAANIAQGLTVRETANAALVERELPFMATENLLMLGSRAGGDRQELHERIRQHSLTAHEAVERGEANPLIGLLVDDPEFPLDHEAADSLLDPADYTGRSAEQVDEFLATLPDEILHAEAQAEELSV